MNNTTKALYIALVVVCVTDLLSTAYALQNGLHEKNPLLIIASSLAGVSVIALIMGTKIVFLGWMSIVTKYHERLKMTQVNLALGICIGIYGYITIENVVFTVLHV